MILSPSILSTPENDLEAYVKLLEDNKVPFLHLDIMDGKFVPNNTEHVEMQKKLNKFHFTFDTHLMVEDPENYYRDFVKAGSNYITFHLEASKNPMKLIQKIHSMGAKCGISIKPNTNVQELKPYLPHLDLILIMSVEPGFGGQKFMESSIDKVKYLAFLKEEEMNLHYIIEVDGGINQDIAKTLKDAGADAVVIGSSLYKDNNKEEYIKNIKEL